MKKGRTEGGGYEGRKLLRKEGGRKEGRMEGRRGRRNLLSVFSA